MPTSASPAPGQPAQAGRSWRGRAARLVVATIWLTYLGQPLSRLLAGHGWSRWLGLAGLAAFVGIYLGGLALSRTWREAGPRQASWPVRWGLVVALLISAGVTVPGAGDTSLTFLVFVSAMAVAQLPLPAAIPAVAVLLATAETAPRLVAGWREGGVGLGIVLAAVAVWAFRTAFQRQQSLVVAERELAESALEAERTRIARDLHDILGHSLTVVAVKAELAQRLLNVDPDRARAELADLESLTRDALADVRTTALGIRGMSLPGEIAAARSALESAGVDPILPTAADGVPSRWRELFAWTIREGVTNVIRHSGATTCTIDLAADSVTVLDDGRGCAERSPTGQGLEGLRQRSALAGAVAATGPGPDGRGFCLSVVVPGTP